MDLQETQQRIVSAMMASQDLHASDDDMKVLDDEYMETVIQLDEALGPTACCSAVDAIAWATYVNLYRKKNGNDPGRATREAVLAFICAEDEE